MSGLFGQLWSGFQRKAGQYGQSIRNVTDTITGHSVEKSVDEFTEVYTRVLIGMDRALQKHRARNQWSLGLSIVALLISIGVLLWIIVFKS